MREEQVRGYKVFSPDWTCRGKQYTCPGKFEEEGYFSIYVHGMHFCQTAADCFNYYRFDSKNKVAEVVAYGPVITKNGKSCTNKLEIVREIPWDEVLRIVNLGENCTGHCNTGCNNAGNRNVGCYNSGDCNTGHYNAGDRNAGNRNAGNRNVGNYNAGNRNTGDCNTGDWNTGDWNAGNYNIGCFNTEEQNITLFNKLSDMTLADWFQCDARHLLAHMPKNVIWVLEESMSAEEKAEYPNYKTTGGYLKKVNTSEHVQAWWDQLSESDRNIIFAIPNFDPDIFEECTGIRVK